MTVSQKKERESPFLLDMGVIRSECVAALLQAKWRYMSEHSHLSGFFLEWKRRGVVFASLR